MKKETIKKRLLKLQYNKSKTEYKVLAELCGIGNKTYLIRDGVVRPCFTSGTGRYISNKDYTFQICSLLDNLKIRYIKGNDAPHGGLCGNFIKITTKIID